MKNVEDVFRLSPIQAALFARPPDHPELALEHLVWHFRAGLDEALLEEALRELVHRHPALRTAFFSQGLNEPMQVIRERVEVPLERHDLTALPEPERQARIDLHLDAERAKGTPLTAAPLIRAAVFRTSAQAGVVTFGYHPLALDPASALICLREWWTLYQAARERSPAELEKGRPYREYVAWIEQQDVNATAPYVRERLDGTTPTLFGTAPSESPAPSVPHQLILSATASASVATLLRQNKLGLDTVLHAAWALLLQPTGGDAVFGARVSGRSASLARSDGMVGRFAAALPRRVSVPSSATATTALRWLRDLQAELTAARPHEHVSTAQVATWLGQSTQLPLFESTVAIAPAEDERLRTLGKALGFRGLRHLTPGGPAPLQVTAAPGERIALRFLHDPVRFSSGWVAQLAARLGTLLEALAIRSELHPTALAPATSGATVTGTRALSAADLEAVLGQHPLVKQVTVRADDTGLVAQVVPAPTPHADRLGKLGFGLFYFADEADGMGEKYRVYLEGAKFADRNGFRAVWTPERHFHEHGGLYPNPSVLSAALATITQKVSLRAGSVVFPLHHPLRIAEEWATVDNLSGGRVAVSITSGWVPNDFAFAPDAFAKKREVMFRTLEEVRTLWRGGTIPVKDGAGNTVELKVYPRPLQAELPIWMTCAGSPDLFIKAGEMGVNILTSLLQQSLEEAAEKIALYREARARAGHDPATGIVSLMMHTYVGEDPEEVLEKVRGPLTAYLRSHVDLMRTLVKSLDMQVDINEPKWIDYLASFAFERYYRTSALIGTPASCYAMIERLVAVGVDEVASFIDFGLDADSVLGGLQHLAALKGVVEDESKRLERLLGEYVRERLPELRAPIAIQRA